MPDNPSERDVILALTGDVLDRLPDAPPRVTREQLEIIERHQQLAGLLAGPVTGDERRELPPWLDQGAVITTTPRVAAPGEQITIAGSRLLGATRVVLGHLPVLRFQGLSDREVRMTVPDGFASAGHVEIDTPAGHARSADPILPKPRPPGEGGPEEVLRGATPPSDKTTRPSQRS